MMISDNGANNRALHPIFPGRDRCRSDRRFPDLSTSPDQPAPAIRWTIFYSWHKATYRSTKEIIRPACRCFMNINYPKSRQVPKVEMFALSKRKLSIVAHLTTGKDGPACQK